jgi:hypothetical protein
MLNTEAASIIPAERTVQQGQHPRPVSVAELTKIIESVTVNQLSESAGELEHLQLTERLSSSTLTKLSAQLKGQDEKNALMVLGDASSFLEPPPDEVPRKAIPEMPEQKLILLRVADYLRKTIPKLPNFYARRFTTSFSDVSNRSKGSGIRETAGIHAVGKFKATVYYRGGKEVVREEGARDDQLVTEGIFGPILATVISDVARSATTEWSRWEYGPNGPMAVFRFQVSQSESHYDIWGIGELGLTGPTAYHGEIGVDPNSGTILRLVLKADPGLGSPMTRADVMVEYGSVTIGGRAYTCPLKSVSYFVGALYTATVFGARPGRQTEQLNDVTFGEYHVFRTEMRIVQ